MTPDTYAEYVVITLAGLFGALYILSMFFSNK